MAEKNRFILFLFTIIPFRYLIKWVGYPTSEATWQSEADCAGCTAVLARWEKKKGDKNKKGKKEEKSPVRTNSFRFELFFFLIFSL